MMDKPTDQFVRPEGPAANSENRPTLPKPPKAAEQAQSGQPGGGYGRVDVTGTVPGGVRVDPNITQGHPGYQESGGSEIIPDQRLRQSESAENRKGQA